MSPLLAFRRAVLAGGGAGLVGGVLYGAALVRIGELGALASLFRTTSTAIALGLHLLVAAALGAGFAVLIRAHRPSSDGTLFWGLTYGTLWWFVGPLTLVPLLSGRGLGWTVPAAQRALPSLFGHWIYGLGTAFALMAIDRGYRSEEGCLRGGVLARGALAGAVAGWALRGMLAAQPLPTDALAGGGAFFLAVGGLAGLVFAMLHPVPHGTAGASLTRGTAYGFVCWIFVAHTLLPLTTAGRPGWSVADTRAGFAALPAYVLFGATLALVYKLLHEAWCLLLADEIRTSQHQGLGARVLRAVGRGALAGAAGGLLFTVVMVQVGFLPMVARLVGSSSALTGFVVHLLIANVVGMSYGLLYRNQSYDAGTAIGWGTSYGLFWWFLGPLTLMPLLLGATPRWTVDVAAGMLDSLVGHLAYGAALGLSFHRLESRYSPWWIPYRKVEEERVRRKKEVLLSSAPALWTLMVLIALLLPVILSP